MRESALPELLSVLRYRWKLTLGITAAVLLGAAINIHLLPSEYDGKAIVSIAPRANVSSASSDTVRVVGPKYIAYVKAPATIQKVALALGLSRSDLSGVDASLAQDTGTMTITVRKRKAYEAAVEANAFAHQVVNFSKNDPLLQAQLVAPALPSTSPAAPPRALLDAAALAVGLLVAIGVAVILERGQPRVRSWREMAQLTGYPVLGRVPFSRQIRTNPTTAFTDPVIAASFRTLRANLEPLVREKGIKLIVVTSPSPTEGKTTVAALLAEALSRLGARTLLVDADLHRPRVSELMSLSRRNGLAGVLRGGSTVRRSIEQGWLENLFVLPTAADTDAGDLLARKFGNVADEMIRAFDFVVVDTPPVLGTDDTRAIVTSANGHGVVLVIAAGSLAQPVNEAVLAMESLQAPVLGLIGNRMKEGRSYSNYYGAT